MEELRRLINKLVKRREKASPGCLNVVSNDPLDSDWSNPDHLVVLLDSGMFPGKVITKACPKGNELTLEEIGWIHPRPSHDHTVPVGKPGDQCPIVRHCSFALKVLFIINVNVFVGTIVEGNSKLDDVAESNDVEKAINLSNIDDMQGDRKT